MLAPLSAWFIMLNVGVAHALSAQDPELCAALLSARRSNQVVRATLVRGETVTGRVPTTSCLPPLQVGQSRVSLSDLKQLEVRIRNSDSVIDGSVIGGLAAGAALGLAAPVMTGGDASFLNGFLAGAPLGALAGLLIDAAREKPARWNVAWQAR